MNKWQIKYYASEKGKANRRKHRKRWRDKNKKKSQSFSYEAHKRSLVRKAGRPKPIECEIPNCHNTKLIAFDHCHNSGKFRGWICHNCNMTLGLVKDNPIILRDLAAYLEYHK